MKIGMDTNSLTADINDEIKRLDRADKDSQSIALSYSASIAGNTREYIRGALSTKYRASTHNSVNLGIASGGFAKDSKNRKMIGFSLKSVTQNWKRATLKSYPLNLYENDTKVYTKSNPWIKATHSTPITYKRKGTHILAKASSQLGNIAKMSESDFLNEITTALKRIE